MGPIVSLITSHSQQNQFYKSQPVTKPVNATAHGLCMNVAIRAGRYWNLLSQYIIAKSITVLLYIMIFFNFFLSLRPIIQQSALF